MIIFDLDSISDNSHRRHFIVNPYGENDPSIDRCDCEEPGCVCEDWSKWKPDYAAYNAACDKDDLISQTELVFRKLHYSSYEIGGSDIQIWTDRCESTKVETVEWLNRKEIWYDLLKMRPIGDDSPQEELFMNWANENCADLMQAAFENRTPKYPDIEMVFSSHKPTVEMFRKRGVYVFDCNQGKI